MSGSGGPSGTSPDAGSGEVASSSSSLTLDARSSSSWINSADVEIQRDLIGRRVFECDPLTIDRFEVEKLVGAGSSAAVYAARDPLLDRRVAIKVLGRVREGRLDVAMERLIREARALAHLSHPNVVAIYDVGQWNGRPFIAMELIEGATLAQWLVTTRRSSTEILAVFREAGRGLAAAHARGHVHRDFKPANVLVAHTGRVVVSDFGLVDDTAQAGAVTDTSDRRAPGRHPLGTPAYVAPEQRAGAAAHPSADVYSFALALVEAVLGYHPMPESTVRWKPALRHRVPRRLHRELCAAMALDAGQRAQSLGPLLDALSPRHHVQRRRIAGALAIGVAVAIVAVMSPWRRGGRPSTGAQTSAAAPHLSLMPAKIVHEVEALLATAPEGRDRSWSERARAVLMLPIPTRVPCRWAAHPREMEIVGDQVVALDSQDRLMSCAIATGTATTVAEKVACLRPVDDTRFGVEFRSGKVAVYQHAGSWSPIPLAPPAAIASAASDRNPYCSFRVGSRGVVPLQIWVKDQPMQEDFQVLASGDRRMFFKPDDSVWMQAGNSPPEFMARLPTAFRFDDALHYGVMARAGRAQVLDLATRSVVADAPAPPLAPRVDVSDDGSTAVATGSEQRLLWWRRGMRQWQSQPLELASPDLRISPNGERVLISAFSGGPEVRDLVSGRRYPLAMTNIVRAQFLDDEHVVAVDGSGAVWRWSLAHARSWVLADHFGKAWMWGFAVCDHGQSVLTATNRKDRAILISSPSGAPQRELARARDAQIYGIACAGDRVFAGTRDGHLLEWEWPSGRQLADHDTGVRAWIWTVLTAQPVAGNRVTVFGTGQIFDLEKRSGGRVMTLRAGAPTELYRAQFGRNTGIDEIAISSDGRTAAAVTSSGELIRIDLAAGTTSRSAVTQTGEVRRVRYTAEDHTLVTAGEDGYLRTWRADDLTLQSEIYVGHGWLDDLDVHGTTALVATMEGHVGEWDLVTRRLVLDHRGYGAVAMARFDASGRWIVSGDSDGHACVHRTGQEGCYAALVGHKPAGPIRHMQFLADGQIITASDDGTVWQWNPPYEVSNSELARELQGYLFDRGKLPAAGAMAPSPGSRPRLRR